MSVEVPLRPSCQATSHWPARFARAVGKLWSSAAFDTTLPDGFETTPAADTFVL